MSNEFYVFLPSNTAGGDNKTNKFTVRLPNPLKFTSKWSVGLAGAFIPYTWPTSGTTASQWIDIAFKSGVLNVRVDVAPMSESDPKIFAEKLNEQLHSRSKRDVPPAAPVVTPQPLPDEFKAGVIPTQLEFYEKTYLDVDKFKERKDIAYDKEPKHEVVQPEGVEPTRLEIEETAKQEEDREEKSEAHTGTDDFLTGDDAPSHFYASDTWEPDTEPGDIEWDRQGSEENAPTLPAPAPLVGDKPGQVAADLEKRRRLKEQASAVAKNLGDSVKIRFDEKWNRYVLEIASQLIKSVTFSEQLGYILGFGSYDIRSTTTATYAPDLRGGINLLYVYADLVVPSIIGDSLAQLLRICAVQGKPGDVIEHVFIGVHYHKLITKEISQITVQICNADGRPTPFQGGEVVLILHFKKDSILF